MQSGRQPGLNIAATEFTKTLDQGENVIAEYIWIDGAQIMR